jgi:nicotinic acetylcholine receptor
MKVPHLLIVCIWQIVSASCNENAKRLYDDLMISYNRLRRPAKHVHKPLTVGLKLRLSQIIDVV